MISFKKFIVEGGNAVKGVTRINQENVAGTMNNIYKEILPKLKLTQKQTASLGSTGKKKAGGSSGDVDLALDLGAIVKSDKAVNTLDDVFDKIVNVAKSSGHDFRDMRSMGLVSISFPIKNDDGKQEGETVQLDLMPTENLDYSSWAYYSPAEWESQWKGLYRNELLYAIARFMDYKTAEKAMDKEGKEVDASWERNFFDLSKGLLRGKQSRMGKKGLVKSSKTLEKWLLTMEKEEIVTMLFGPKYKSTMILTWEDAFKAVTDPRFVYKKSIKNILQMTKDGIIKKGYTVPPELDAIV